MPVSNRKAKRGVAVTGSSRGTARSDDFLPLIAAAFVEFGYRRTTTAELARRCDVRENELYRIWPSKKQMFLAALDYVYNVSVQQWQDQVSDDGRQTAAEQILEHQARSRGDSALHRIVFSGLSEIDDPEIRTALAEHYRRFHEVLAGYIQDHRNCRGIENPTIGEQQTAWALIGLASIFDIRGDLGLGSTRERRQLLKTVSESLLNSR